ncbi:wax ester/triacylglycerol synthase family O-acyltransferase [Nocardia sp. NBC_01503]|uniref:wax ester/triacylglycerol synthase family O-acyltransferase n=1 Tax=Nocardia sp. NBC_01503 TaxID=2975997 RepID=UPI002E7BB4C8|nr:wax ester/triacylglycerol synthase family O-acyltransferase [Nocardia sp. NBC_01503]WTL34817.1 wax ester/triacylglycerol synthase family O-acyltransferase [Nocardia sp. NBC_01503]
MSPAVQLTARDAVFVYDEFERHPSNIVAVYAFDATASGAVAPDAANVIPWVRARLGHFRLFQRRLARVPWDLDLPYWVHDSDFDIDRHVRLEPHRDWAAARPRIAEIAATRMDLNRPPWRIHIFDRVTGYPGAPGAVTLVLLGFHHSAGDGMATRELELRLFDGGELPATDAPAVTREWSPRRAFAKAAAVFPYRMARFAIGLRRTRATAAQALPEPLALRPATRFNRRVDPVFGFDLLRLPMAEVLKTKAASVERITVNDLVLTVVSDALASYLEEHGETPEGSLAAMVPRSMRGLAHWNSANQLTQMSIDLHTDIADPVERLLAIRDSARREKQRGADPAVLRQAERVQTSPAWLLRLAGWGRARRQFDEVAMVPLSNTTVSNVPPVAERLEFLGAPMLSAFGALPIMDGDGLRHLISSQGDELIISFSADTTMLPDTGHYAELLLRSFERLRQALEAQRARLESQRVQDLSQT